MKKRNHILTLLAALVLLAGLLAGCGSNEEPSRSEGGGDASQNPDETVEPGIGGDVDPLPNAPEESGPEYITWDLTDGVLTISGRGEMDNIAFSKDKPWYDEQDTIHTIIIEPGVTRIGNYSFNATSGLTSVAIPDSVVSIGKGAFWYCTSLTSVTIPGSVTTIGEKAFSDCTCLTSVTIPDSVTSIGEWAFCACSSLTSVTIPDSVTSISYNAFSWCSGLTSVTIPDSVTSIDDSAFAICRNLTDVYFTGTQAQFDAISIGPSNDYLLNATIHYGG